MNFREVIRDGECSGLNFVPLKRYVEVVTHSTFENNLTQRQGLWGCNQVKMRSLEWTLVQYDSCSDPKGKCGCRDTCT